MYEQILTFWFEEIDATQWWIKDDDLDQLIIDRFLTLHKRAVRCEFHSWRKEPKGRLAEIIILDQFSRNMFRHSPLSFSNDSLALALSQEAISVKADMELTPLERCFLYMPFMHSESLNIHKVALDLYIKNGIQSNLEFEIKHKKIIEEFGRYPHRNSVLDRESTEAEEKFLMHAGSSF